MGGLYILIFPNIFIQNGALGKVSFFNDESLIHVIIDDYRFMEKISIRFTL
jgi:hypothetical protein